MNTLHLSENIAYLRKKNKLTQEQLADFLGVTKASVSKWETGQSMPDISLLPKLAAYFDISIDNLIGYESTLSKEQIQKIYNDLCNAFSTEDFDTVMSKTHNIVKKYYSCYDLLQCIIYLWLNHYMLAEKTQQEKILSDANALCTHIINNCKNIGLCKDIIYTKASIDLLIGNTSQVIEELEDIYHPESLFIQGESILINAYIQSGELNKACDFTQINLYMHLLALVNESTQFIMINMDNLRLCEKTVSRIMNVICEYNLENINFNCVANFCYQSAAAFCYHDKKAEALAQLKKYAGLSVQFLKSNDNYIKEDDYFDRLNLWIEKTTLSGNTPRNKKIIYDSLLSSLNIPAFNILKDEPEFKTIRECIEQSSSCLLPDA